MDKQTARTAISNNLGKRAHLITDGTIETEMIVQQSALEARGFLPWFLGQLWSTANTTSAGTQSIAIPTNFIREFDDSLMTVLDPATSLRQPVVKEDFSFLEGAWLGEPNGLPKNYALFGNSFYLFPTPDAIYTLALRHYAKDTALSAIADGAANQWLTYAPHLLIALTSHTLAAKQQNPRLAQTLLEEFKFYDTELMKADAARRSAARDYVRRG